MMQKKLMSFFLCMLMLLSVFPTASAQTEEEIKEEKLKRQVYLHAFDEKREVTDTANRKVVYVGDDTNIYLAVDDPNKGNYLNEGDEGYDDVTAAVNAEYNLAKARGEVNGLEGEELDKYIAYEQAKVRELTRHAEPQFDMQGYTVKIYYDPKYFTVANEAEPLNYTLPNELILNDDDDDMGVWDEDDIKDETGDIDWGTEIQEEKPVPGYLSYSPKQGTTDTGKNWVGSTVLLMESGFFPETAESIKYWYNLCSLKLKAKQPGYTQVYIEVDTSDERTLELFAKNNNPEDDLSFNHLAINDGVFYITIDDKDKPRPPKTDDDHLPGTYNEPIEVKLQHDNEEECEIYYTLNENDPREPGAFLYNQGGEGIEDNDTIPIATKTTILAATKRSDGKWSNVATFVYDFLPHTPYLFNSSGKLIPNIYNDEWTEEGYFVFASDKEDFSENITDGSTVYYTFKEDLSEDFLEEIENNANIGTDPYSQWVALNPQTKQLNDSNGEGKAIKEKTIVRLATVNKWGISNVAVYHLGIKPGEVKADPGSGLDMGRTIELTCDTPYDKIYYTLNGGDPRANGIEYDPAEKIELTGDSVIKAAAIYENEWGDVSAFWYLYTTGGSGVTAFYPSGTYEGSVDVTLMPNDGESAIEISYDDGIKWVDYVGPMTIEKNTEFNARLKKDIPDNTDMGDKFVYIIKPKPPEFSPESILPESAQFTSADTVTVFSPEAKEGKEGIYDLWITTDGTEPTEEDSVGKSITDVTITDYTTIKAVVAKTVDGVTTVSDTVTAVYGVVYGKPAKPLTTLSPGYYTKEIGGDAITTRFKEVPVGTKIYYTVAYHDDFGADPDPTKVGKGTYLYDPENPHDIEVIDSMIIKAVAVRSINGKNVMSEVGIFNYLVTPEAPKAAPSAVLDKFPLVEVKAVTAESEDGSRATISYTISDGTNEYTVSFPNDHSAGENPEDFETFYINTNNGKAYRDKEMTKPLGEPEGGVVPTFTDYVILELTATLDGVTSETAPYIYQNKGNEAPLSPPYADKESGTYEESSEPFSVKLETFYGDDADVIIEWMYKTPNNDEADEDEGKWFDYNDKKPEFITEDTILFVRTKDAQDPTNISDADGYVYNFVPPAPIIDPDSGIYIKEDNEKITIKRNGGMEGVGYRIRYSQSTENGWGSATSAETSPYVIDETKTVRAYVENLKTLKTSEVVFENYVVEDADLSGDAVTIEYPFSKKRISAHLLGKGEYAKGVILTSANGEPIYYNYKFSLTPEAGGGSPYESENIYFDKKNALVPTERMDNLTITAWIDGDRLATIKVHEIDFIHLGIPGSTLSDDEEHEEGTQYQITSEYKDDPNIIVYYTTNGDDPTKESQSRKSFTGTDLGELETLSDSANVKAVYYSACGDKAHCEPCAAGEKGMCPDGVYGEVVTFKYTVPTVTSSSRGGGGGGGGGGTAAQKRKYTKDIFGNEHPTHIGYIKGYPDGSVRPDGHITREEVTAILYRITNHDYESPFVVTGDVFPDVKAERWSVKEIEYMSDKEVVLGYPDGEFKPADNLKRSEFSALVYRFTGIEPASIENKFEDLPDDHWACREILALAENGLVEGYEDGTYKPDNNITRAEVMTVINKILGRKPLESYVKSLDFNPFNDLELEKWYYVTVLEATITHDYYLDSGDYEYKWENWK